MMASFVGIKENLKIEDEGKRNAENRVFQPKLVETTTQLPSFFSLSEPTVLISVFTTIFENYPTR